MWGDDKERSSIHSVTWEKVCQPKDLGGLGLRPIRNVNQDLLAKLAWQYLKEPRSLWVRVLAAKYGKLKSMVWRGILHVYELLKNGLESSTGNGEIIRIWWQASEKREFHH